jgi:F420-non-reducing hydrogenase small subunit
MSKPKVGFYWCASCGGCEEAVVDLAEDILTVVGAVDIVFWPVALDFKKTDVEAMADGEMAACFINGAVRTSEQAEMVKLLRKKAGLIVAFGACAHLGGIPGLSNFYTRQESLNRAYLETPSTQNAEKTIPQVETKVPEGIVTLPGFDNSVKTLNQVIDVDYFLPGCAPPPKLILGAVMAILEGKLPPKGETLAPDVAVCDECPRKETKPEKMTVESFKRPFQALIDPEECILAQGFLCLGPVTRKGCDAACPTGNMPCTGCQGPTSAVKDYGAKALSAIASILEAKEEADIDKLWDNIPDPAGTFYRYSLPASLLFRRTRFEGDGNGS